MEDSNLCLLFFWMGWKTSTELLKQTMLIFFQEDVAGVTLLALGNGMPDVMTACSSVNKACFFFFFIFILIF